MRTVERSLGRSVWARSQRQLYWALGQMVAYTGLEFPRRPANQSRRERAVGMIGSRWIRPCTAIAAALAMAACGDSPTNPGAAPVVLTTRVDDAGTIFRSVFVELDGEGAVRVQYWSGDGPRFEVTESAMSRTHLVKLFRLRSASTYQYEVTPVGSDGASSCC